MDFQMYDCTDNAEIEVTHFSPVENSMDNEEYFDWTNSLKIDEKFNEEKNGRKRKFNGNSSEVTKLRANGLKIIKPNSEVNIDNVKQSSIKKQESQNEGNSRMPQWQVEDITDLNADIEGSLNGLGSELSNNSYNMSDAILSISGLTVFKQEAPSPPISQDVTALQMARQNHSAPVTTQTTVISQSNTISDSSANVINTTLHQLLGQTGYSNLQSAIDSNLLSSPSSLSQDGFGVVSSASSIEDSRFQYVLAAATSIATKINEDTLTYLNQGQSYEIKLKKLGDLSTFKGKLLKSVIRICFHERRLQYMEKEQMILWQKSRPGDRILEVDVPLSYGLCDVSQPTAHNTVHFSWDPTKEVGVYIKVNCISTEFTPKKHGGEKGVPFRIQVETYQAEEGSDTPKRLHAAVCQIKVFKLKGADRKHKQDREKIMKRPPSEQEKFQPSYECTVLSDIPCDSISTSPPPLGSFTSSSGIQNNSNPLQTPPTTKVENSSILTTTSVTNSVITESRPISKIIDVLSAASDPKQIVCWLVNNRFEKYLSTFSNFSGADMLRMTKDDFIQICGQADGIRLYNAVHLKAIAPKLTIYVCRDNRSVYNAIFLSAHSSMELLQKLSALIGVSKEQVRDIYMQGPHSIHIHLSNDVISHIKEETMFSLDVLQDNGSYILLLKPTSK